MYTWIKNKKKKKTRTLHKTKIEITKKNLIILSKLYRFYVCVCTYIHLRSELSGWNVSNMNNFPSVVIDMLETIINETQNCYTKPTELT